MSKPTIGWIGLGKMGVPMSLNLIKAGYQVTVYNRTKEKEETLKAQGAVTASSASALIQQSDIIVLMVSDDAAIEALFTGENGLLSANVTGKTIINMSTVSPKISKEMAGFCKERGNEYLDAPVSGSVKQAEEGQLVIMVGGEQPAFEQIKPLLAHMGKLALFTGGPGTGNIAKLAVNTLLGIYAQGLAEVAVFARQNGIDTQDLFTLINNGAMSNIFTKVKGEAILQDNYQAAFALKHIAKDLRLAKEEGLNTPLGDVACHTFQQAAQTLGEEDIIAVIKHIDQH